MVCFYYQIISTTYEFVHFFCNMSDISKQTEAYTTLFHKIAHIIGTIMRNSKWCNLKLSQSKRNPFFYDMDILRNNLLANTIIPLYPHVNFTGCIYW